MYNGIRSIWITQNNNNTTANIWSIVHAMKMYYMPPTIIWKNTKTLVAVKLIGICTKTKYVNYKA